MPPLASELVATTKRHLYSGYQDELNELDGDIADTAGTINLAYDPIGISRGSTIAVGLEEMFVWGTNQRQLTVRRGMNGSTAAAHADGALVHVRPKFSDFRIFQALNDELRDLSSPQNGLYRMQTTEITLAAARMAYGLPADFVEIYEIRTRELGPNPAYPRMKWFGVARNMPTDDFAAGSALLVQEGAPMPGTRVWVRYKAAFTLMAGLTDDVPVVTGLPPTAVDIPPLGAAIRLVAPREVKRSFTEPQGEPRRAEEVPPGAITTGVRNFAALRQQRIVAEAARLQAMYPPILNMR